MRTSAIVLALLACCLTLAPTLAAAEAVPIRAEASTYDLGVRIGGYGFRREGEDGAWDECRMNGFGVFASRAWRGPLYVETALDLYTSAEVDAASMDLPIDRMSALFSVAAGTRTDLTAWLRGYVQVGGGLEVTRAAVPYGDRDTLRDTLVLPQGFFGVGLDLRIARRTYAGATLRALAMGNFTYQRAALDFATQAQFYVRRDL